MSQSHTSNPNSSPSSRGLGAPPSLTIISIGLIVGVSFALTKIASLAGISAIAALFWQLALSGISLLGVLALRGEKLRHDWVHVRYYVLAGLMGVTGPSYIAFIVLEYVPAGLFTALVMLSPLATVMVYAVLDRAFPDRRRIFGIFIGLVGMSLTVLAGAEVGGFDAKWLALAL
ncbi:MAG: DMT family transporter, partial [Hoeflea sp. D1-CHI-28]